MGLFDWFRGSRRNDATLAMVKAYAAGRNVAQIRSAISTISTRPLDREDDLQLSGIAAAELVRAVTAPVTSIDDVSDRLTAGLLAIVFANHFSFQAGVSFEQASFLSVLDIFGPEHFKSEFNGVLMFYNLLAESQSVSISVPVKQCAEWLQAPSKENLNALTETFEIMWRNQKHPPPDGVWMPGR